MNHAFDYCLTAPNIKKMLLDAGVIGPRTLHGRRNREVHCNYVLDMSKCHAEEWEKEKQSCIEYGCIDYAKKNDNGNYGVRRDLTEQEIEELPFWPVAFKDDDEMNWNSWPHDDDPAFFISKLFPDITFDYLIFFQNEWDGGYDVKDGEFTKSQKWLAWVESDEYKKYHSNDDFDVEEEIAEDDIVETCDEYPGDTLPF